MIEATFGNNNVAGAEVSATCGRSSQKVKTAPLARTITAAHMEPGHEDETMSEFGRSSRI
jgi:hypothetical protein